MHYDARSKKGYFKHPGRHDPDIIRTIGIILRPDTWAATTVYYKREDDDADVVLPTTFQGLYAQVKYPGKSGATDPFTGTYRAGDEVEDGSCVWEMLNFNLMVPGETIAAVSVDVPVPVAYTCTNGVTVSGDTFTDTSLQFDVDVIAVDASARTEGYADIKAHVIKSTGKTLDYTIRIILGEH